MRGDFGLVYPLWTDPSGPGELLDRAVGEVGLDHLTIPVLTGRQEQFRLGLASPPHAFVTEGGWHFPPDPGGYKSGRVRPRPARWFGKRNVLGQLCDYTAGRSVAVIFRIDLRAVSSLLEHEPHLRPRNAWGEEVASAGGCPSNPDLRELLQGALEDLRRYGGAGFQLVDWAPDLPTDRKAPRPLDWHAPARRLLDLCFCPACRQTATVAGADPDQAARSVQVHFERLLSQPLDDDVVAKVRGDEVLEAYLQARRRDAGAWLQRLAERYGTWRRYLLTDAESFESIGRLVAGEAFRLVLRSDRPPGATDESGPQATIRLLDGACGLALPLWRPTFDQADQLFRVVNEARRAGTVFFDFEGLEEAPEEALDWLRQAVRYAHRE